MEGLPFGMSKTAARPAEDGGAGAGGDALHIGLFRVAQMGMGVDQARQHMQAGGVEHLRRFGAACPGRGSRSGRG